MISAICPTTCQKVCQTKWIRNWQDIAGICKDICRDRCEYVSEYVSEKCQDARVPACVGMLYCNCSEIAQSTGMSKLGLLSSLAMANSQHAGFSKSRAPQTHPKSCHSHSQAWCPYVPMVPQAPGSRSVNR